jgi:hypothetical protein
MSYYYDTDTIEYLKKYHHLPDKWYNDHGLPIPKCNEKYKIKKQHHE